METQMAVQIPAEMLHIGVLDALLQPHQLHVLRHHVNEQVGGQSVSPVGEPLDQIGVHQSGDAHRAALVVDLGIIVHHLKLGDHIAELSQLPVAQAFGGLFIQHGNLVVGNFVHLGGEVAHRNGQQLRVGLGPENNAARQCPHQSQHQQCNSQNNRNSALFFQEAEVVPRLLSLKAGSQRGADTVHGAQQQGKGVKIRRLEIDGGEFKVEVEQSRQEGDNEVDCHPGGRAFYCLSWLLWFWRMLLGRCAAVEAFPPEAAGVGTGKSHFCSFLCGSPAGRLRFSSDSCRRGRRSPLVGEISLLGERQ